MRCIVHCPNCIPQREIWNPPCLKHVLAYRTRMKQRSAQRGNCKPSLAKRVAAWRERADRAYTQRHVVELKIGALVEGSLMTANIQLHHGRLRQLCGRLKSPMERSLQSLTRFIVATTPDAAC